MTLLASARLSILICTAVMLTACASTPMANAQGRGRILTLEPPLQTLTRDVIDQANEHIALSGQALCDVKIVQLTYQSIGVSGEPEMLSAGLYIPENCPGPFPILAQAHGTQSERHLLTTDVQPYDNVVAFFAARGYLVVATDYLGLGKSSFPYHPYLHADSEASAIIDAIRAARTAMQRLSIPFNEQVMLFGYSQGGHAAMAAQREIERHHRDEINLVASAPMAGPYHLTQTFLGSWFGYTAGQKNALASELFAYTVVSYNRVYGTLYSQPDQLFAAPYAGRIEELFSGQYGISEILGMQVLPPGGELSALRTPDFTAKFLLDEQQPLRVALRQNDLLDWTPKTPMVLCGSRLDTVVDFQNAHAAQAAFRARGVEVPVIDVADELPAATDGTMHHRMEFPCYARVRAQLFDPLVKRGTQPAQLTEAKPGPPATH